MNKSIIKYVEPIANETIVTIDPRMRIFYLAYGYTITALTY